MSSQILWPLLLLTVVLIGGFYWLKRQLDIWAQRQREEYEKQKEESQRLVNIVVELQNGLRGSLDKNLQGVQSQLQKSNEVLGQRLDNAARVMGEVQKHLGIVSEASRYLRDLHEILQAPKLRGNIGEQILNDLLKQHFPSGKFNLQHAFRSGKTVDAVIQTAEGLIPVDSKFPMESFRRYLAAATEEKEKLGKEFSRDVKGHIEKIARDYILPAEGTLDFAVMYVPSEPVAYEVVVNFPELLDLAHNKRVAVVSPNQFNNFLQVILLGFEKQQIGEQAKLILAHLRALKGDATRFGEDLRLLAKHVTHAKAAADSAQNSFARLEGKINDAQLTEGKTKEEPPHLLEQS